MAQVNAEPGKNQTFGNATVVLSTSSPGASDPQAKSAAVVVPYMQNEPGRKKDTAEGNRS